MPFRLLGGGRTDRAGDPAPAIAALLAESNAHPHPYLIRRAQELPAGKALVEAPPAAQVATVRAAVAFLAGMHDRRDQAEYQTTGIVGTLVSDLLRRDLPFAPDDVVAILTDARRQLTWPSHLPLAAVVRATERFVAKSTLDDALRAAVEGLVRAIGPHPHPEQLKLRVRLETLLSGAARPELDLDRADPWGAAVTSELAAMDDRRREAWSRLLAHGQSSGAAPTRKWLKQAEPMVAAIGAGQFRERAIDWLGALRPPSRVHVPQIAAPELGKAPAGREVLDTLDARARAALTSYFDMVSRPPAEPDRAWLDRHDALLSAAGGPPVLERIARAMQGAAPGGPLLPERNADALRALVWACTLVAADSGLAAAIGDAAERCLRKVPGYGAFAPRVGHACVWALGALSGVEPVAQLARLKQRVKYPVSRQAIEKALADAARRASVSPDELEEMAAPAYGLDQPGTGQAAFGAHTATIRVTGADGIALTWTGANGRAQKSTPAEVQRDHADELKHMKRALKDMGAMLPAQRDRIERLYAGGRRWPLTVWRARYLDHPLLSVLCRRLVWRFTEGGGERLGIFHEGRLVDSGSRPLELTDAAEVSLWHPLGSAPETVFAWREWLRAHEVRQPFKQAHREIYIPTDAELRTATYSNRFAAHILRQHQFAALCRERGWRYHLQGQWDSHNVPTLPLPRAGLAAEFWVEPLHEADDAATAMGIYTRVATDQVRFVRDGVAVPLAEVPPIVFSEVMRDVDLFVAVTSIGADPTWAERGDERTRAYWQGYAFGELSASAETRRDVLATLLPMLKIGERCALDGRFLTVRGNLRSYRIHLGSGNVLMEPDSRYLCIVPDRAAASARAVVLPFEGDGTLSVILSKAFLLAADDRIEDETIRRQIREA